MPVSLEDLIAQRDPSLGDDQADADLLAVRTAVAGVAPLGLRVFLFLPLEVGRGDVVQEDVVADSKELAEAFFQMLLDRIFVLHELVQCPVEPLRVNLLIRDAKQISQRTRLVKLFRDMELTRWLAEPRDDQNLSQPCPGDLRVDVWQEGLKKLTQAELFHDLQGKPDIAEAARPLHADSTGIHLDPGGRRRLFKERSLDSRVTQRGLLEAEAASVIRIAEVGDDPLARTAFGPDRLDQRPVVVTRPVLLDRDLAQKHEANIQPRTRRTQEVEFALHDFFKEKCATGFAIANFEKKTIKNIFQLSNLG